MSFLRPHPSPFRFLRIGDDSDGGYLVPDDLDEITGCVSPGVGQTFSFEDSMSSFGIQSLSIDKSASPEVACSLIELGHKFLPFWLDMFDSSSSISL